MLLNIEELFRMDWLLLVNSMAAFLLATSLFLMRHEEKTGFKWMWLTAYAVLNGVYYFLGLFEMRFDIVAPFHQWSVIINCLIIVMLLEFVRSSARAMEMIVLSRLWYVIVGLLLAVADCRADINEIYWARFILGGAASFSAAALLHRASRRLCSNSLKWAAVLFIVYGLTGFWPLQTNEIFSAWLVGLRITALTCIAGLSWLFWSFYAAEIRRKLFPTAKAIAAKRMESAGVVVFIVMAIASGFAADVVEKSMDEHIREDTLGLGNVMAAAMDIEQLQEVVQNRNLGDPYQRMIAKFERAKKTNPDLEGLYLFAKKDSKIVTVFDDNLSADLFEEPSIEEYRETLDEVFNGLGAVSKDLHLGKKGDVVSGFIPVNDESGDVQAVIVFVVEGEKWRIFLLKERFYPLCIMMLIYLATLGVLIGRQKFWESGVRVAAANERLELALRGANDGLWDWNLITGEAYFSPQYLRMLGMGDNEAVAQMKSFLQRVHPDDYKRLTEHIEKYISDRSEKMEIEMRIRHEQGHYIDVLSRAFMLRSESGKEPVRLVGTHVDITERNRILRELEKAKEDAESGMRAKSMFLANMSHEIRTPMNAILGFSQLLQRDAQLSDESRRHLRIIQRSGEHLLGLINDVLAMSKLEAGSMQLQVESFDIRQLLQDIEAMLGLKAKEKGLEFTVQFEVNFPHYVATDKQKLRQMLINLIGNAVKFTAGGRVCVTAGVAMTDGVKRRIVFVVKDTGPGISENEQSQLFEVFYQAEAGRKTEGGTGLGLALSRNFARLLGGDITVNSELGVGSTFVVEIAVTEVVAESGQQREPEAAFSREQETASRRKVLIVDDDDQNRRLLAKLLETAGFDVQTTDDAETEIDRVVAWGPQLILTGWKMSQMDGFTASRKIKERFNIPIVGISASGLPQDRQAAMNSGVDRFLQNPINTNEVLQVIGELLNISCDNERESSGENEGMSKDSADQIPFSLLQELGDALVRADYDAMLALTEQIALHSPTAAETIAMLVAKFDYEGLRIFIEGRKK